jgi:hypothetical protein
MSVKGQVIEIRRSELHTASETMPLWEIPLIEAIHEHGIKVIKEVVIAGREPPNPMEEFQRLENRYKRARNEDGSFGLPVVAAVYGQHAAGLQALSRAIEAAKVEEDSLV